MHLFDKLSSYMACVCSRYNTHSDNGQLKDIINYLLTESEVFTGKSRAETLPYRPSDSEVNTARFSRKDRTFEVNKLFIIWLFAWLLQARNRPVGITGE